MVTRYDLDGRCDPVEGGSWVHYEDHQAEVAQLQARVAELEAALREYRGYAHHHDAGNTLAAMRHFEKFEADLERLLP